MSEALFWKPGSDKPAEDSGRSKQKTDRSARTRNDSPSKRRQQQADPHAQASSANATSRGSGNASLRKTTLSGTTMNMRFMMRKQQQQATDTNKPKSSPQHADIADHEPMHCDAQSTSTSDQDPVFMNIIGRRSFGGFNRHTENAWNEHTTFYGTTRNSKQGNGEKRPHIKKKRKR